MNKIFKWNHAPDNFFKAVKQSSLGQSNAYPKQYDPNLLVPIPRQRVGHDSVNYYGTDYWNAYELFWKDIKGIPQVGHLCISYDAHSPYIIESKSLKLFLHSLYALSFTSETDLLDNIQEQLSKMIQATVNAHLVDTHLETNQTPLPRCIDTSIHSLSGHKHLLFSNTLVSDALCTHRFRSICPVTGQPDFATIVISYEGMQCSDDTLFEYLIGYQDHPHFHEQCIDQIFDFLISHDEITTLTVQGLFTRRGGIDINPLRSTVIDAPSYQRTFRQ